MPVTVRSFAKINLGLCIGPPRRDGFHELRTVYQTISPHDIIRVDVVRGSGIEICSNDPRVPKDESNTCYRIAARTISALKARGRIVIEIDKRLPLQGGLGGASANAVATMLALEQALRKELPAPERFRIAAEIGSDLPLFLVGGTVLGVGRGEEVYPVPDLPRLPCVVGMPEIGVSTPKAFADWDDLVASSPEHCHSSSAPADEESAVNQRNADSSGEQSPLGTTKYSRASALTRSSASDRMFQFSRRLAAWLSAQEKAKSGKGLSGVPASDRGRAETPLLDLVRTGIENDFEQVVFPKYPELRKAKRVLESAGALYAALSGSGSSLYGLFATQSAAKKAAARLQKNGTAAVVTTTLTRRQYWRKFLVSDF